MLPINSAKSLLNFIGGTASLVAGLEGHYWADASMAKKSRTRGRLKAGTYGKALMAHFASKRV
jgi:hypothetical protein